MALGVEPINSHTFKFADLQTRDGLRKPKQTKQTNMPIKAKAPVAPPFEVGQTVQVDLGAGDVNCEVTSVDAKSGIVEITDEDGAKYDVEKGDWSSLTIVEAEAEPEPEKPAKGKVKPAKPAAKGKAGKVDSFAKLFKDTEAAPDSGGGGFPEGTWEAFVVGAECEAGDKGTSATFQLVGVNAEEVEGIQSRMRYFIIDAEGEATQGMTFFKRDLAKLMQIEVSDLDDRINEQSDLDTILEELAEQQVYIEVNVRPQKNDSGYMNTFLKDVLDQDTKPEVPAF